MGPNSFNYIFFLLLLLIIFLVFSKNVPPNIGIKYTISYENIKSISSFDGSWVSTIKRKNCVTKFFQKIENMNYSSFLLLLLILSCKLKNVLTNIRMKYRIGNENMKTLTVWSTLLPANSGRHGSQLFFYLQRNELSWKTKSRERNYSHVISEWTKCMLDFPFKQFFKNLRFKTSE